MPRPAAYMIVVNVAVLAITGIIIGMQIPVWQLGTWMLAVVVAATLVANRQRMAAQQSDGAIHSVRLNLGVGITMSIVWAVPSLLFLPQLSPMMAVELASAIILLMIITSFAMATTPAAALSWLFIVGSTLSLALFRNAMPLSGCVTALTTGVLLMSSFSRARMLLRLRSKEIALAQSDETVSLLLYEFEETQSSWLWEIDAQRCIVRPGARFAKALERDAATIEGKSLLEILAGTSWESGAFSDELRMLAARLKQRESFRELVLPVRIGDTEHWWELAASPRYDDKGNFRGFRGVASDVTEQRQSEERINRMARHDALTGLPNRLLINETLADAMQGAQHQQHRCAFMMIDLDRFKSVNDTLGHPVGDRLLRRVSERLSGLVSGNEMIGRLGGDEFAVVIRNANDSVHVEQLALKIIDTLSQPYEVDQHTLYIGASVGVAIGPRDGRTAEMLVRSADLALYQSKDDGGGSAHYYDPKLHVQAEERRVLEIALRSAIDSDQFHIHYQPVVDARTGRLVGFEALLRWTHPGYGDVEPAKFIRLAEETRLITPIGAWVLRTACREAATWPEAYRIAVNISAEQLHSPGFVQSVADALEESGLAAHRLELEVTESVFLDEGSNAITSLEKLVALGVRLSMDDFGTGYSALGYLSRIRFAAIKIDRSFVRSAATGKLESVAILRAVVTLAESLGMGTIAEGVESAEEHRTVQDFGCSHVQGNYFARPMPADEARNLINNTAFSIAVA
ncbi:putative bifunctional diguanylate cyclase/phosphodiesterase [Stakelama pacifica]|uniref:Diguanylate cyclase/phosphodiesterase with PAS/PAC sensor(S) n=1 Tax=Stakelama pacifica TaxID=517720 RepID=A0A4V3BTS5_9SPHN|nr:EAL domain-containing protein [Stakelama pacifica]TDN84638.1 diguanylate cyclase/phosphodiesterase with PAS/PAC sensor(s) [Stakelama pacifica]GGO93221.1 GGDEF domain-containing protein [Stakelama pacifica]